LIEGATLLVPGVLLGGLGAMVFSRLLSGMLYGIRPTDPWALATTVLFVLGTGVLATVLPARRASRINPMQVLRAE
jgi:ABC-type antimicrobial peptide transport system permease subunit